jgi:hypothetical protein
MIKVFLIVLLVTTAAQAETYKWTDREGTVHFSGTLAEVPASYRKGAESIGVDINGSTTGIKAVTPAGPRQRTNNTGAIAPQLEGLKERVMKDEGIMTLIGSMQDDPEIQALLNNAALMSAIQAGDIDTLKNNPDFLKILNNPRLRDIVKRIQ